jgi:hypothetical protein
MPHSDENMRQAKGRHRRGGRGRRRGARSLAVLGTVAAVGAMAVAAYAATRPSQQHVPIAAADAGAKQAADTVDGHSPSASRHPATRRHHHRHVVTPTPTPSPVPSSPSSSPPPADTEPGSCSSSSTVFAMGSRTWPNCTNTGVPDDVTLKSLNSPNPTGDGSSTVTTITKSGTVIDGVDLTGSIDVWANNVTIENSRINDDSWWGINLRSGYQNLRVLHCTIVGLPGRGPDNGAEDYGISSSGGYVEVGWSDISEVGEGISLGSGYIHDNYVHNLQSFIPSGSSSYEHLDALISDGGSGLTIEHNTMLDQVPPQLGASASIGLFNDSSPVTNTTVSDNFIAGGAYALYPGGGSSSQNIVITDNVFSTMYWSGSGFYGADASSYWHSGSGNQWSGNTWADGSKAGKPVNP